MHIERMSIDRIDPAPYNPRLDLAPGDPEYRRIARSIDEFGCVEPLVWNKRTGHLVGGHQRLKVLAAQGATEVEVSVVDLPPTREKALNIALNRISGDWDPPKLAKLLDELVGQVDLDVGLTGFDLPDASALIAEILHTKGDHEESFDVEGALQRDQPAVTRPGDLIELGRHRLLCGDASRAEDLRRLLADDPVDLLFTTSTTTAASGPRPITRDPSPRAAGRGSTPTTSPSPSMPPGSRRCSPTQRRRWHPAPPSMSGTATDSSAQCTSCSRTSA